MMRALIVSAAVILSATAAQAEDKYIWSEVTSIDHQSRTIALAKGGRYRVANGVSIEDIMPGMMVEAFANQNRGQGELVYLISEDQLDTLRQDTDDSEDD